MTYPFLNTICVVVFIICLNISSAFANQQQQQQQQQANAIVKAAIDYWRDKSSYSEVDMIIHRASWQRTMTLRAWTQGMKKSLIRVIAPKKDKGNANLMKNDRMWAFSPKTNRVIRIPSSMMNQSWMGSDFSNNDVAKADNLLKYYTHSLKGTGWHQGKRVYIIESVPYEYAPVVWGKEVTKIRADYIMLEHAFYDQDNILVKKMVTQKIKRMGGKLIAAEQYMQKANKPYEWTKIVIKKAKFNIRINRSMFTRSNLRNPR